MTTTVDVEKGSQDKKVSPHLQLPFPKGAEPEVSPQNFIEKQCIVRQNLDKNKIKSV